MSLVIANFGLACSIAWTLANRGSKYWQENWEQHVREIEDEITGPLFKDKKPIEYKGQWLSARRYSVSKLAIALSDYVTILWLFIIASILFDSLKIFLTVLPFTIIWVILILIYARSTDK